VLSLLVVVLLLTAAMGWALWRGLAAEGQAGQEAGLPWQVQPLAEGRSEVFGLVLGQATLADVQARFPADLTVGLIVPNGGPPALEALVETFRAGFVTGKLVLAFQADPGWLQRAHERAPRNEVGEGGRSRRYTLAADDETTARASRLSALALLPSLKLDEATVTQRFGPARERITGPLGETHLLYPDRGIAIAVPPSEGEGAGGRTVIQYTAPAEFEARLRAPLLAASASAR
jgi:hypothetical protein